jgi:ABC-2 type transport system permease protein
MNIQTSSPPPALSDGPRLFRQLHAHLATARLCATQTFSGGVLYVLGNWILRAIATLVLLAVWRALLADGADTGGLTPAQVLTYLLLSAILAEQLNIVSPASTAFWEGTLANRYTRPLGIVRQLVAETMGRWLPHLAFFSLPMWLLAGPLGVSLLPASPAAVLHFALSLGLAIGLGFALDLLFAALALHIPNAGWMALYIRNAFFTLFSGALIPFALLPWGLGAVLELLPFGSLASAPLTMFTGMADPLRTLLLQAGWNVVLWPLALWVWRRSVERMVAYGG